MPEQRHEQPGTGGRLSADKVSTADLLAHRWPTCPARSQDRAAPWGSARSALKRSTGPFPRRASPPGRRSKRLSLLGRMGFIERPSPVWTVAKSARPGRRLPGSANIQRSLLARAGQTLCRDRSASGPARGVAYPRISPGQRPSPARARHTPDLKAKYAGMTGAGKPAKVALTARMRKLNALANALVRDDRKRAQKTA